VVNEAEVVRRVFRWCVGDGLICFLMEKRLREREVPTYKGRPLKWCQSTVRYVLRAKVKKKADHHIPRFEARQQVLRSLD